MPGAYPAGTFLYEVGGIPQVTAIDPAGQCTVFISQNGPLDFNQVDDADRDGNSLPTHLSHLLA